MKIIVYINYVLESGFCIIIYIKTTNKSTLEKFGKNLEIFHFIL